MVKRFWVCKIREEEIPGFSVKLEFAMSFDERKDAEKYIKMDEDLFPSSMWTILEIWQKEVR